MENQILVHMNAPRSIIFLLFYGGYDSKSIEKFNYVSVPKENYGVIFKQCRMIITSQRICKIMRVIGNLENHSYSKFTSSLYVTINVAPVV